MYFVVKGKLSIIANDAVVATITDGSYVGEVAILYEQKRYGSMHVVTSCQARLVTNELDALCSIASVRALTYCDLLMLSKVRG